MATLYVTENGVRVCKSAQRLVVQRGEEVLEEIPIIKVERVVLMGRGVSITTAAMHTLSRRGVDVLYLTSRGGYISRLVGSEHKHSRLRFCQARSIDDPGLALKTAREIVRGKIFNQRTFARRQAGRDGRAKRALDGMDKMLTRIETAHHLDELRGMEGMAAKEYFSLLRRQIRPPADGGSWNFARRDYYPPPDPVNAMLSFGYTLLLNDLVTACQLIGLDPQLGFFHAIDYGRPSMALDLEEEFRPVIVDSIVLQMINRPMIQLGDFEKGPPKNRRAQNDQNDQGDTPSGNVYPIHLKPDARQRFIEFYEQRVSEQVTYPPTGERTTFRRVFELQAQQMARLVLAETDRYEAYLLH
jgi:CRISP-associated protein Cas1